MTDILLFNFHEENGLIYGAESLPVLLFQQEAAENMRYELAAQEEFERGLKQWSMLSEWANNVRDRISEMQHVPTPHLW